MEMKNQYAQCAKYANKYAHPHQADTPILFPYDTYNEYDRICKKNMQNMHIPHLWYKKIVKYEKNAKYIYVTPDLPAAGRQGVKV